MAKKQKTSAFRGKVGRDAGKQKNAGSSYGYLKLPKGVSVYTPTPGNREKFDIVPYIINVDNHPRKDEEYEIALKGGIWYCRPFKTHRGVGAENDTVVCLTSFGKKCPICEYRKKRAKEGADKDELKAYNTSNRNLYAVIPKGIKGKAEELHIFDMSQFLFQDLLNEEVSENEEYEGFAELEGGFTLQVRWREESFAGNKYAEAGKIEFLKRDYEYDTEFLEEVPCLDEVLTELSYSALEAKFLEMEHESEEEEETEEEEEEEKPRSKSHTKPVSKKSHKKEEEEETEEEEEEASKPTRKTKVKLTWADLSDMDETELGEVVEKNNLDIDSDDFSEEDLRNTIAEEMGIEIPKKASSKKETKKEPVKETPNKTGGKEKCPSGHKFGVDTDDHKECDSCKLWDKCIEKKEE